MFAALASARDQIIGVRRSSPAVLTFERLPGQTGRRDVPLPVSQIVYPRLAIAGGVAVCVCYAEPGDTLWLANDAGVVRGLDVQVGAGAAIAVRPSPLAPTAVDVAVVLRGGAKWQRLTVDAATLSVLLTGGAAPVPLPDGTTSGGFLEWPDAADTPTWTDPARFATVGGRRLVYPLQRGDWTIGQDGEGPERVLAYHHPTTTWWIAYDGLTQHAPQAAATSDGACIVGITTGAGLYVHSRDFVPLPATEPIPAIGRPLWMGWFEFPASVSLAPCNCVLHVTQGAPWLNLTALDGQVIARYVAGDPDGDMEALEWSIARGKADGMGYPVIAYWTRRGQAVRVPAGVDILGVEAYRGVDESVAQFEARLDRACQVGLPVIPLAQCYTSNRTQTDDLLSIVPVVGRVARRHANVIGIVGFSGSGRPTGYQDHPEVHGAWRELFAGITGVPVSPVSPPSPKPEPVTPSPTPVPVPVPASRFPRARSLSHA